MAVRSLSLLVGMVTACLAATSWAEEASLRSSTISLLEVAWDLSDEAKSEADVRFAKIASSPKAGVEEYYGHGLLMMYQRRYEDALASLDQAVKLERSHLPALRAKIWLALLLKKYDVALAAMEKMAKATAEAAEKPETESEVSEAARFLGSVYGYVDGPLGELSSLSGRKSTEEVLLKSLAGKQLASFTEARQAVIEKYDELVNERADSREAAIAESEAEKQKVLEDVERRREEMASEATELKDKRAKLQTEMQDQLDEISKEDRPLQTQLSGLQSRFVSLRRQHDDVVFDIERLEIELRREKDPVIRDRIRFDIDRLITIERRYDVDLASLGRQIGTIQSQRAELAGRAATVRRNLGGQIDAIDRKFASFQAEERKLAGTERKARKPSTGSTGKVNALGTTTTALKTYEPFPIEQEKQRLLERLK